MVALRAGSSMYPLRTAGAVGDSDCACPPRRQAAGVGGHPILLRRQSGAATSRSLNNLIADLIFLSAAANAIPLLAVLISLRGRVDPSSLALFPVDFGVRDWTVPLAQRNMKSARPFPSTPVRRATLKVSRLAGGRTQSVLRPFQNFRWRRPHQAIIQSPLGYLSSAPRNIEF